MPDSVPPPRKGSAQEDGARRLIREGRFHTGLPESWQPKVTETLDKDAQNEIAQQVKALKQKLRKTRKRRIAAGTWEEQDEKEYIKVHAELTEALQKQALIPKRPSKKVAGKTIDTRMLGRSPERAVVKKKSKKPSENQQAQQILRREVWKLHRRIEELENERTGYVDYVAAYDARGRTVPHYRQKADEYRVKIAQLDKEVEALRQEIRAKYKEADQ